MLGHELEPGDHAPDEVGAEEAGDAPDQGPDHGVGGHAVEPELQADDQDGEADAEGGAEERLVRDGIVVPAGPGEREHDEGAKQDEPHWRASRVAKDGNEAEGVIGSTLVPQ